MSVDLQALYQEVVLDHNRQPRNFRAMSGGRKGEGYNRMCGDRVTVHLRVEEDVIRDACFQATACAIAKASASLMTEHVQHLPPAEAASLAARLRTPLSAPPGAPVGDLGALGALAGVRLFPIRIKCALLPWEALRAALDAHDEVVSTE
jgi:nitrogen fixation NifU-like protein